MKKILCIALTVVMLCAVGVGTAFSAWRFEKSESRTSEFRGDVDDIIENYDIPRANVAEANTIKTYDIYLYPSALYLNDYINYIEGGAAQLPEEKYGYIEPSVGRDGSVTYTVHATNDGDMGYLSEVAGNSTYTMEDESIVSGVYSSVYEKDSDWNGTDAGLSALAGKTVTIGKTSVPADTKYLCGDPEDDKTPVTYTAGTTGVSAWNDDTGERHNWRNLHYYDRFGYWQRISKGNGRYLPIKIHVDENFSNTYLNSVVLSPFADMGDPHDWFVYSFSCWAYVAWNNGVYTEPYYATDEFAEANKDTNYVEIIGGTATPNPSLGSFCPTAVTQYFDIIQSFDDYADADGVIRLFPKFSNGKGYLATTIKDGGGDAIKAIPTYNDENGNVRDYVSTDRREIYMFYSTDTGVVSGTGTNSATVHVSVLPNIAIDDYNSLDFKFSLTYTFAGWQSGWRNIYSFGRGTSSGGNKSLSDTLRAYGYGLYNLYLFITDVAATGPTNNNTLSKYAENLEKMRQNLVNKSDTTDFPSLFGKNLLPIATATVDNKVFMLVGEKVREAKFIGDVNFDDGTSSGKFATEEELKEKYLAMTKSFRLINKDLYGYNDGEKETDPINSQFPYCYILQNVDFTEATTQFCQIRFQRYYRPDLHFASPSEYRYTHVEFSDEIYERGFGEYFDLVDASVLTTADDGTTSYVTQQVIKLKSEEKRGVYDIILVFRSAREGNTDSDIAYNIGLYAYRHTNIFVKIYESDLTETVGYYRSDAGAVKTSDADALESTGVNVDRSKVYNFIDHTARTPIFNQSYPIGVSLSASDTDSLGGTVASRINAAVKGDPAKIKLYDHVTRAEVAHYERTDDTEQCVEYNGAYYKLVFEHFKVRKNYVFYMGAAE